MKSPVELCYRIDVVREVHEFRFQLHDLLIYLQLAGVESDSFPGSAMEVSLRSLCGMKIFKLSQTICNGYVLKKLSDKPVKL